MKEPRIRWRVVLTPISVCVGMIVAVLWLGGCWLCSAAWQLNGVRYTVRLYRACAELHSVEGGNSEDGGLRLSCRAFAPLGLTLLPRIGRIGGSHTYVALPLVYPALLAAILPAQGVRAWMRVARRRRRDQCVKCGYALTHCVGSLCSECGYPVAVSRNGGNLPRMKLGRLRAAEAVALVNTGMSLCAMSHPAGMRWLFGDQARWFTVVAVLLWICSIVDWIRDVGGARASEVTPSVTPRRRGWRLLVVPACLALLGLAAVTAWPLRARFWASQAAFEATVREVQTGVDRRRLSGRIGLFWVRRILVDPDRRAILFCVGHERAIEDFGIVCRSARDLNDRNRIHLGGPWFTEAR